MRASGLERVGGMDSRNMKRPASAPRLRLGVKRRALQRLSSFEIESAFFLQESKVAENVLLDFLRRGFGIDLLQIRNDLLDGVPAVAALDNFQAGAVQAEGALGHQQHALLVVFAKPATRGEAWTAAQFRRHPYSIKIPSPAERRQGAASRDSRKQNRERQAEPKECRTWRATRRGPSLVQRACGRA